MTTFRSRIAAASCTLFFTTCAPPFMPTAQAADMPVKAVTRVEPSWFIEGRIGAAFSYFNRLEFVNPVGAGVLGLPGPLVPLNNTTVRDTSFAGKLAVGWFLGPNWFARLSYQHLGEHTASGFAFFDPDNFRQDLHVTAQTAMVGIGVLHNLSGPFFFEAIADVGIGFVRARGRQGENLGATGTFPTRDQTKFVVGAGAGPGYRLSPNLDVIASVYYTYFGEISTGVTGTPPPAGMNPGEQLRARLGILDATIALRGRF